MYVIELIKEFFMGSKKVFLLQDAKEQNEMLRKALKDDQRFEIVGEETDGEKAIERVLNCKPDLLILELVLSGYDGISVITNIRKENKSIKIIVLSALNRDEIVQMSVDAGADYFFAKPCNLELIKERIIEVFEKKERSKEDNVTIKNKFVDERLSSIFINVGIPPHIKGYAFLREGVKLAINRPEIVNNITKQLYPMIAETFNTSASKVERAIRHAIEVAWNRGRIDNINNILGVKAFVGKEKPTNGEFIALVADKMMLELA